VEVSSQLHALAVLPPGKEPLVPTEKEAGWAPEPFVTTQWKVLPSIVMLWLLYFR